MSPQYNVMQEFLIQQLNFTPPALHALHKIFHNIDYHCEDMIRIDEFFEYFRIPQTLCNILFFNPSYFHPSVKGVFMDSLEELDANTDNWLTSFVSVSFFEFTAMLWTFLTLQPSEMGQFILHYFDMPLDVVIPDTILNEMVELLHYNNYDLVERLRRVEELAESVKRLPKGSLIKRINIAPLMEVESFREEEDDKSNSVSIRAAKSKELSGRIKVRDTMIAPIRSLQTRLCQTILGVKYWTKLTEKRKTSRYGDIVTALDELCKDMITASVQFDRRVTSDDMSMMSIKKDPSLRASRDSRDSATDNPFSQTTKSPHSSQNDISIPLVIRSSKCTSEDPDVLTSTSSLVFSERPKLSHVTKNVHKTALLIRYFIQSPPGKSHRGGKSQYNVLPIESLLDNDMF